MRTESARILRDASKLFGAQLTNGAVALVFSAWLIRSISREELALYPIFGLCVGFVASISNLGLTMAQQRLIPERMAAGNESEARAIARTCLRITVSLAAVMGMLAAILAPQLSRWLLKTPEFTPIMRGLAPGIFLGAVSNHFSYLLQSTNRFGQVSLNNIVTGCMGKVLAVPLYIIAGRWGLVMAMTMPPLLGVILAFIPLRRFLWGEVKHSDFSRPRSLLHYSLPFYGTSIVTFLNTNADSLLLAALTSPKYLATYYVAYQFVSYLFQFGNAGFRVLVIKVSQLRTEGVERVAASFTKSSRYLFLFFIPSCGILAALAPIIIRLYAGAKYAGAGPILAVLCLYMFFFTLFGLHRFYVFSLSQPVATLKLQMMTASLTLSFTAVCVYLWGGMGAAVGQAIALALAGGVGYVILRRDMPVRYDFAGARIGLVSLIPASAVMVFPQWLALPNWISGAAAVIALPTFVVTFLRVMAPSDRRLLQDYLPKRLWEIAAGLAFIAPRTKPLKEGPGAVLNPAASPVETTK